MTKIRISRPVLRLVEGKIQDRICGNHGGKEGDVYFKMIAAGANEHHVDEVWIDATPADMAELIAEMEWALDGVREISFGEAAAARALLKRCKKEE